MRKIILFLILIPIIGYESNLQSMVAPKFSKTQLVKKLAWYGPLSTLVACIAFYEYRNRAYNVNPSNPEANRANFEAMKGLYGGFVSGLFAPFAFLQLFNYITSDENKNNILNTTAGKISCGCTTILSTQVLYQLAKKIVQKFRKVF